MTEQVEVTQADREAAAAVAIASDLRLIILEGRMDEHIYTQAFARHRIAAQAELLEALEDAKHGLAAMTIALEEQEFFTVAARLRAFVERAETALASVKGHEQ